MSPLPFFPSPLLPPPLLHQNPQPTPESTKQLRKKQQVSRTLKRIYSASALNIAIQDGPAAGQSVPHVHAHIIPRKYHDLDAQGGGDALYGLLEGPEGDVGGHLFEAEVERRVQERLNGEKGKKEKTYNRFPVQEDENRKPRTMEEMIEEAEMLAREMKKDEEGGEVNSSL